MTAGYTFAVTCPRCGGEVEHLATGAVHAGTEAGSVFRCARCRHRWHVLVTIRSVHGAG